MNPPANKEPSEHASNAASSINQIWSWDVSLDRVALIVDEAIAKAVSDARMKDAAGIEANPRMQWEHDGNLLEVAKHMRECGLSWVPTARIIGNCRAGDIARIAEGFLRSLCRDCKGTGWISMGEAGGLKICPSCDRASERGTTG